MGKHNGTYVPWHESFWTHRKTKAAAKALADAGLVEHDVAACLVARALHALACWALRDGDTGSLASLSDAQLAMVAWPEAIEAGQSPTTIGNALRTTLRMAGFLDGQPGQETIHDFEDFNDGVLTNRRIARTRRRSGPAPKGEYDRTHERTNAHTNAHEYPASASATAVRRDSLAPKNQESDSPGLHVSPRRYDCEACSLAGRSSPAVGTATLGSDRPPSHLCAVHLRGATSRG